MERPARRKSARTGIASNQRAELFDEGEGRRLLVLLPWQLEVQALNAAAQPKTTEESVRIANDSGKLSVAIDRHVINGLLKKFRAHDFFEPYFMRGRPLPLDVYQVRIDRLKLIDESLDYLRILKNVESPYRTGRSKTRKRPPHDQYGKWVRENYFGASTLDEWYEAMRFLFSGEKPTDTYIIPQWIEKLRKRMSVSACCRRAGIGTVIVEGWLKDPVQRKALRWAKRCVRRNKLGALAHHKAWQGLPEIVKKQIKRYAVERNLMNNLRALNKTRTDLNKERRRARHANGESAGKKESLVRFINAVPVPEIFAASSD